MNRPLGGADLGGLLGVEFDRRADPLLREQVGRDRGHESLREIRTDILEPEAAVAAVPGHSVAAAILDPEDGGGQHTGVTQREPDPVVAGVHGGRPGGLSCQGLLVGHHREQVGIAATHGEPRAVDLGGLLPAARHPSEIGECLAACQRLVFGLGRIAKDPGAGHAQSEGADGDRDGALLLGHSERGVVAERNRACKPLDHVPGIDDRLAWGEYQLLRDGPRTNLRRERERQRFGAISFALATGKLPRFRRRLAVGHVLFAPLGLGIAPERHAEEVAPQRHEHRGRKILQSFVLPRRDVVGPNRCRGLAIEGDRRHVAAELRDGHLDRVVGEDPRRLGTDRPLLGLHVGRTPLPCHECRHERDPREARNHARNLE